jgi:hypothetical protein
MANEKNLSVGRPKGSPNKSTKRSREMLEKLLEGSLETLKDDLKALKPKDRIHAILTMARFVLPVLKESQNALSFGEHKIPTITFTTRVDE